MIRCGIRRLYESLLFEIILEPVSVDIQVNGIAFFFFRMAISRLHQTFKQVPKLLTSNGAHLRSS